MMFARQDNGHGFHSLPASVESYISAASAAAASASAASASASAVAAAEQEEAELDLSSSSSNGVAASATSGIDLLESTTVVLTSGASAAASTSDLGVLIFPSDGSASTALVTASNSASPAPSGQYTNTPSMITIPLPTQPPRWPGWHSYAAATSTTAGSSFTDSANTNPNLTPQPSSSKSPKTAIIAGVVGPIVFLLASGLVFLSCLRRRRRRRAGVAASAASSTGAGLVEKILHKRLDSDVSPPTLTTTAGSPTIDTVPQLPQLVLSSPQNPTYFTGLDTFSVHSSGTTEDPPPPYRARSVLSSRSSQQHQRSGINSIPLSPISAVAPPEPSPFSDAHAVVARSPSTRSFASTLYSSNASVYEARPARLSTGAAEYVMAARLGEEQDRMRSPFADPDDEAEDAEHTGRA